jgi:hypothetical protein
MRKVETLAGTNKVHRLKVLVSPTTILVVSSTVAIQMHF